LRSAYQEYFARTDVASIVFPTAMVLATLIGQDDVDVRGKKVQFTPATRRNISPGSTAGVPGLVLPAGLTTVGFRSGLSSTHRPAETGRCSRWA